MLHRQLIMDSTGHTTHSFDPANAVDIDAARERFDSYKDAGFTVAERTGEGSSRLLRTFDPNVEETLFIPRVVGG